MAMKNIITEWNKFLKEVETQPQQYTTEQVKQILAQTIKGEGLKLAPNITYDFAVIVAEKESTLNPYAIRNTRRGLFQVGKDEADEIGEGNLYATAATNIHDGIKLGLKFLQRQYEFVVERFEDSGYNTYALAYMAFNMGRTGFLRLIKIIQQDLEPDQATIDAIIGQTKRFRGKTNKETVNNYFNYIINLFANV